jgi:uncharacterized membrane protein YtjA (UPF0391 family)
MEIPWNPAAIEMESGTWGSAMLQWTLIFLLVALVAAVFGFGDIAEASAGIAKNFLLHLFDPLCGLTSEWPNPEGVKEMTQ